MKPSPLALILVEIAMGACAIAFVVWQGMRVRKLWKPGDHVLLPGRKASTRELLYAQAQSLSARYRHVPEVRFTVYCGWTVECTYWSCSSDKLLAHTCKTYDDAVQIRDRHAADPRRYRVNGTERTGYGSMD